MNASGSAISAQELFEHVATLAGIGYDSAQRAAELHDQALQAFEQLNQAHGQTQQQILALAGTLQRQYAPAHLEAAVVSAQNLLEAFRRAAKLASQDVQASAQLARQQWLAQDRWQRLLQFLLVGALGLLLGLLLAPALARTLPVGLQTQVAALVLNDDRWTAGAVLMHAENPSGWQQLAKGWALLQANHEVLSACQQAASKTGKEQRCTLRVGVPKQDLQ